MINLSKDKQYFKSFNFWLNVFILVGMLTAIVITNIYKLQQPDARHFILILASIGALMGVCNTVLSANGNILTFVFGFVDVVIASIVALDSSLRPGADPVWGNFALHAFYFLPMQFVGWWQWRKHGADSKTQVKARRLDARTAWGVLAGLIAGTVIVYLVLCRIGGSDSAEAVRWMILFDAIVFSLNILGQILMSLAYMEQWFVWILVNVFSICLWSEKAMESADSSYTVVMVIKYCFYFLNSLNGLRIWLALSRNQRRSDGQ